MSVIAAWRGWRWLIVGGVWHFVVLLPDNNVVDYSRPKREGKRKFELKSYNRFKNAPGATFAHPAYDLPVKNKLEERKIVNKALDALRALQEYPNMYNYNLLFRNSEAFAMSCAQSWSDASYDGFRSQILNSVFRLLDYLLSSSGIYELNEFQVLGLYLGLEIAAFTFSTNFTFLSWAERELVEHVGVK